MKRFVVCLGFLMTLSQPLFANGNLFNVTASGTPATLAITLCLNGTGPQSCQNYSVNNLTLQITTLIPHHTYANAGIKINTAGYTPTGCTAISNGYCLFSVSDASAATINVVSVTTPLSINLSNLGIATNGAARQIRITNSGVNAANNVTYTVSPSLPAGTTISPASCGTIAAGGVCTLTVTPGATPSATPGDVNPTPITLTVTGSNTNSVTSSINIVTYGSVYESGYIFSIDDTTTTTGSIGGKVASLMDQVSPSITGIAIIWSTNGTVSTVDYSNIAGIYEVSTAGSGSCNGNSDGACNSAIILNHYLSQTAYPVSFYAAGICTQTIGDYSDWYLPAICEMGYDTLSIGSGCGSAGSPAFQNMQSHLVDNGNIGALSGTYWSSTEYTKALGNPTNDAWVQTFGVSGQSQTGSDKSAKFAVRCVRALT